MVELKAWLGLFPCALRRESLVLPESRLANLKAIFETSNLT